MSTVSVVATKVRIATAASAIAAAATLAPAAVAYASPAAPLPEVVGSTLGVTVDPCNPALTSCPAGAAVIGGSSSAGIFQNPLFWFGKANPDFQPFFGITFPNIFGLDFEACFLGAAIHLDAYTGNGFIGLGKGC
jgi:hypothetical protein